MPDDQIRSEALARFSRALNIPDVVRIAQRGRGRRTARFTLELADGRRVPLGGIDGLLVQDHFARTMAVALSIVPPALPPSEWRALLTSIGPTIEVTEHAR